MAVAQVAATLLLSTATTKAEAAMVPLCDCSSIDILTMGVADEASVNLLITMVMADRTPSVLVMTVTCARLLKMHFAS